MIKQIALCAALAGLGALAQAQTASAEPAITKLTEPQDDYPDVSPDGQQILFQSNRSGNWQIWLMRRDGSALARWTTGTSNDRQPAWSPDGRQVAFSSDRGQASGNRAIFIMDSSDRSASAQPRQLTRGTGQDVHPKWLPDGSGLIFNRIAAGGRQADIHIVELDGRERKLELGTGLNTYASVDRSGRRLVYRGTTGEAGPNGPVENSDIFIANIDGSGKRRVTREPAFDGWPAISPDGRRVAFGSRRGGDRFRIFLMPLEGGEATEIPAPPGYNYTQPAWTPDGQSLIVYRWTMDRAGEVGHLVHIPLQSVETGATRD